MTRDPRPAVSSNLRMPMRLASFTLAALCSVAGLQAAEKPLGAVAAADGANLTLDFDAGVQLAPGTVVGIYGAGTVEKHPLTKEVIIERRKLLAKALVLAAIDGKWTARIAWSEAGAAIQPGFDAVPLGDEAAPNAPPALTARPAAVEAGPGQAVALALPLADPDGDRVTYAWSLGGPAGRSGRLDLRTSTRPEATWLAPSVPGEVALTVTARDRLGQETVATVPLRVVARDEDPRKRAPAALFTGGAARRLGGLERAADGAWYGFEEAQIRRIAPGWLVENQVRPGGDTAPSAITAVVPFAGDLFVVDPSAGCVHVYAPDGTRRRQIGRLQRPSDLAIAEDGTLFVADQGNGGVLVYERDGRLRARLGHPAKGSDGFVGLSRLAIGRAGELACLDVEQRTIQRFDRFQRRLETWEIQGDPRVAPVDLVAHPRGLLVLMADGRIQIFDAKGLAKEALPAAGDAKFGFDLGAPSAIAVDGEEVYVTYADSGLVARWGRDGRPNGLRGQPTWAPCRSFAMAGDGRVFGLDPSDNRVHVFDGEGFLVARVGGLGRELVALACAPDGSSFAVIDADKCVVQRVSTAAPGDKPLPIGSKGVNNGQFRSPQQLAMDEAGRIYVLDADQFRVVAFDGEGRFLFHFGARGKGASEFLDPRLVAVAPAGDAAYVYDYDRYEVKKFALDQAAKAATHVTNCGGKGDSPGQIRKLAGLACDRAGLLYLLDVGREDLQVLDFRGSNAVALHAWKFDGALGVRRVEQFAVAPDGPFALGPAGSLTGFRW